MLNGVGLGGVQHRLLIGAGDPQIEGGDGLRPDFVFPGYIQPRLQLDMVNGKASNFFHGFVS